MQKLAYGKGLIERHVRLKERSSLLCEKQDIRSIQAIRGLVSRFHGIFSGREARGRRKLRGGAFFVIFLPITTKMCIFAGE